MGTLWDRQIEGGHGDSWAGWDMEGYPGLDRAGGHGDILGWLEFEEGGLASTELLRLSEGALEALGVWRVGHQELLLEAVEQLRALVSNAAMGGGVWDG